MAVLPCLALFCRAEKLLDAAPNPAAPWRRRPAPQLRSAASMLVADVAARAGSAQVEERRRVAGYVPSSGGGVR